jgi:endonuclease/exonuclease/phosphatase (EEP) superfamily protein YafD
MVGSEAVAILACDCNTQETSGTYRLLSDHLVNAARAAGWNLTADTLPGTRRKTRLQRLDYVFFRGPIVPLGVYVVTDIGGSDHHPLLASFRLGD